MLIEWYWSNDDLFWKLFWLLFLYLILLSFLYLIVLLVSIICDMLANVSIFVIAEFWYHLSAFIWNTGFSIIVIELWLLDFTLILWWQKGEKWMLCERESCSELIKFFWCNEWEGVYTHMQNLFLSSIHCFVIIKKGENIDLGS